MACILRQKRLLLSGPSSSCVVLHHLQQPTSTSLRPPLNIHESHSPSFQPPTTTPPQARAPSPLARRCCRRAPRAAREASRQLAPGRPFPSPPRPAGALTRRSRRTCPTAASAATLSGSSRGSPCVLRRRLGVKKALAFDRGERMPCHAQSNKPACRSVSPFQAVRDGHRHPGPEQQHHRGAYQKARQRPAIELGLKHHLRFWGQSEERGCC